LDDLEAVVAKVGAAEYELDVARLRRLADQLEGAWLRAVRIADKAGSLGNLTLSPAGELAAMCRMPFAAARRAWDSARTLEELPLTAEALLDGSITPAHASVMTHACTPARTPGFRELEPKLVEAAQRFSVRDFRIIVRRACDAIDGDLGAKSDHKVFERRAVYLAKTLDATGDLRGELDPEGAEILQTALEFRMEEDAEGADEPKRTRPQRRHDALVDICREYLASRDDGRERRQQPHVSVVVDLAVLRGEGHGDLVDNVHADLHHMGTVSASTLRRLTCDAKIHRVLTDGSSQPLDLGRTTPVVSRALWRAVVARDRHCQAPGCDRPPGSCQPHHIQHWTNDGETNLDNLILLCRLHHRERHLEDDARARSR
ncbi:MAG TPA: DUF222 domain-containing protein, partial [Acidimicrobiia bacterium]|nr:DUF222 domain-containing protein [Acidimicrobiia bacterium]